MYLLHLLEIKARPLDVLRPRSEPMPLAWRRRVPALGIVILARMVMMARTILACSDHVRLFFIVDDSSGFGIMMMNSTCG